MFCISLKARRQSVIWGSCQWSENIPIPQGRYILFLELCYVSSFSLRDSYWRRLEWILYSRLRITFHSKIQSLFIKQVKNWVKKEIILTVKTMWSSLTSICASTPSAVARQSCKVSRWNFWLSAGRRRTLVRGSTGWGEFQVTSMSI